MKGLYYPKIHLTSWGRCIIDGTEYRVVERVRSDTFKVEREGGTRPMELHIDEISRKIDEADEVKLLKE